MGQRPLKAGRYVTLRTRDRVCVRERGRAGLETQWSGASDMVY